MSRPGFRLGAPVVAAIFSMVALFGSSAVGAAAPLAGPTVTVSVHNDTSISLRDMAPAQSASPPVRPRHQLDRPSPSGPTAPSVPPTGRGVPSTSVSFDGVGQGFTGPQGTFAVNSSPPDANGAVGPHHYVQTVNSSFAVFNKTGGALLGPVPNNTLWSGFGGLCQSDNDGDVTVLYDRLADRWLNLAASGLGRQRAGPAPDPSGTTLYTVFNLCSNSSVWTRVTFNSSSLAGQQVMVWFDARVDGSTPGTSYMYLDDVSVA